MTFIGRIDSRSGASVIHLAETQQIFSTFDGATECRTDRCARTIASLEKTPDSMKPGVLRLTEAKRSR
jgi:hypothetical protein